MQNHIPTAGLKSGCHDVDGPRNPHRPRSLACDPTETVLSIRVRPFN